MQHKSPKLLHDMHDAASFIVSITQDKDAETYRDDRLLHDAVERNFEIIGEAVNRLAKIDPETAHKLGPYQQIIAFRNILIHGYDLIDRGEVWKVIKNNLPDLIDRIQQQLDSHAD